MLVQHLILLLFWLMFGMLHSLLAAKSIKKLMQEKMNSHFKYYRIIYSAVAILSLTSILIYQSVIHTILFWQPSIIQIIISLITLLFAGSLMLLFARKFFFDLSGADVFLQAKKTNALFSNGYYKYVRHPLYLVTLIFIWSIFFLKPQLNNLISCGAITVYTLIGIGFEEKKLVQNFGEQYLLYRNKTPMLLPKLFK